MVQNMKRKILLVIMDGVGVREETQGNAVALAHTPYLDYLKASCFTTQIKAHGSYVGLPSDKDMGNSEVGHNAIGAGRIFPQGALLASKALDDGSLFNTKQWNRVVQSTKDQNTLHFLGLLSDGNVHSHEVHLHNLIEQAWKDGVKKMRVHCLLDGRDVPPQSAQIYLLRLEKLMEKLRDLSCDIQIASVGGRMQITMDRYNANWDMVKKGWETHVGGKGRVFPSAIDGLESFRKKNPGLIDQDVPPFIVSERETGKPSGMKDGDSVILFNFRGDRSIEISRAFEEKDFQEFKREPNPNINFFAMTEYDGDLKIPKNFLVAPPQIQGTLGEYFCSLGVRQFACSETQKYGHVTYFWNGNRSGYFDEALEHYQEIPSDNISFDQKPWMKAHEICEATICEMKKNSFDFGRINFANGDMVGHTGSLAASVCAVSTVDLMIGRLIEAATKTNTTLVVTADHGNCEEMFQNNHHKVFDIRNPPEPKTSHTLCPVPFYVFDPKINTKEFKTLAKDPSLANIANTLINLMGLEPNKNYLDSILTQ